MQSMAVLGLGVRASAGVVIRQTAERAGVPSGLVSTNVSCHHAHKYFLRVGGDGWVQVRNSRKRKESCVCMSVDLDDSATDETATTDAVTSQENELEPKVDPRQGLEERFAVLNTGNYECRSCGHVYNESKGDSNYPVAAGTGWKSLPEDWRCPTCGASKSYFSGKSIEVAGFVQNQQFGLGGNSLTSGQKSLLIYGTLAFFFALFLSGYFLQ